MDTPTQPQLMLQAQVEVGGDQKPFLPFCQEKWGAKDGGDGWGRRGG